MILRQNFLVLLLSSLLLLSCKVEKTAEVSGTIDYIGSSTLYLKKEPVHYKYAHEVRYPVDPDNRGRFSKSIPLDYQRVLFFTIDDKEYPVVAQPGKNLSMTIVKEEFPDSVEVKGYPEPWGTYYSEYWTEEQRIQKKIDEQREDFQNGESNEVLELYKHRYKLAKRHLAETPLDIYYYKNIGEYLVKRLKHIKHLRKQLNVEVEREKVIEEAKNLNFFSLKSLKAQRAGIRDFTNAYANTFGVKDSLEETYGQELMQYDVKRLGYKTLNAARTSVLKHIKERDALAYAKMYLIAERIGEMSPEVAEKSYRDYLEEFRDYPEYINFLQSLYHDIQKVSPGNTAIPFSINNQYGQTVSMKDFKGKYVLLDFWASWCTPCIREFSYMREVYSLFNREELEIVSLSIDNDSLQWRESVNEFKNPWPQLYAGNGFDQPTFKAYKGGGIPFYVLVNPDGSIERYNDVRPSFNLPKVLDSLITK